MKSYINWSIFAGAGLLLALGVTVFHYFILPIAIRYQVSQTLALENGTEAWERFIDTPIPIILKFNFFQVENPQEILKGAKPRVAEVGPYVYREHWTKVDVRVNETRDSIFYRQQIGFTFDQELSGPRSELDNITTLNPVVHLLSDVIDGMPTVDLIGELLEFGLPELLGDNYGPTMTFNVRDLLFDGVMLPCNRTDLSFVAKLFCSALKNYQPVNNIEVDSSGNIIISIFKFKELGPLFELSRGTHDLSKLGRLLSVDGLTEGTAWRCDSANKVEGYDMVMFSPFVTRSSVIPYYSADIKTTVNLEYGDDQSYQGVDGYKFVMTYDLLGDPGKDEKARCYCPGSALNLTIPHPCYSGGTGVVELSSPLGLPALLSLPHFYQASENWQSQVDGLSPTAEKHESYLNIEPTTGVPLEGYRRVQINVMAKSRPSLRMFAQHANALVPVLWLEEGSALSEKELKMLRDQLFQVLQIVSIVRWSLFGAGIAIFIGASLMAIWRRRQDLIDPEED